MCVWREEDFDEMRAPFKHVSTPDFVDHFLIFAANIIPPPVSFVVGGATVPDRYSSPPRPRKRNSPRSRR